MTQVFSTFPVTSWWANAYPSSKQCSVSSSDFYGFFINYWRLHYRNNKFPTTVSVMIHDELRGHCERIKAVILQKKLQWIKMFLFSGRLTTIENDFNRIAKVPWVQPLGPFCTTRPTCRAGYVTTHHWVRHKWMNDDSQVQSEEHALLTTCLVDWRNMRLCYVMSVVGVWAGILKDDLENWQTDKQILDRHYLRTIIRIIG